MKVKSIRIKNFHQFDDFYLDLTYPKGHTKVGKPLERICLIGQSGSGKTTLLELIPLLLYNYLTNLANKIDFDSLLEKVIIDVEFGDKDIYSSNISFEKNLEKTDSFSWRWFNQFKNGKKSNFDVTINYLDNIWIKEKSSKLIYLPANNSYSLDFESSSIDETKEIIDFSVDNVSSVWNFILDKIQKYQEEEISIRQKISKIVELAVNDLSKIQSAVKELEEWKENEFNPIIDVAERCLNPLLKNLNLRVKTEVDFKTKEDIGFIKIEDFNGNEIPHGLWSTGTKQIVLSALPLYLIKPRNTIILFDEPERSLYPDLQRLITNFYSSLTDNCQFFYSTHSPIIASNFDPWEIVELKFNSKGKIYRELYYEGENHVDNYKWNPKYMRWDDILQRVFDLKNDGSEERQTKLKELAVLNVKYNKLVKLGQENSEDGKKLLLEIGKLSTDLSKWD